jgi:hypothetical protein
MRSIDRSQCHTLSILFGISAVAARIASADGRFEFELVDHLSFYLSFASALSTSLALPE